MGYIQSQKAKDGEQGVKNKLEKASCIAKSLDKGKKKGEQQTKEVPQDQIGT